jgi:microcystin-dependent protein
MSIFQITDAGLTAASTASPTGPFINIVKFRLGDNATTPALPTDTSLAGNQVYIGVPKSYSYFDAQTIQINLEIPALAGPFNYGEIGLYLPGDVLFARFSYGSMLTKVESASSGYSNVVRIKALVRLAQGPSVFSFPEETQQTILELNDFQVLQTPEDHPENPVILVSETNDYQEGIHVFRQSPTLWGLSNYTRLGTTVPSSAPSSTQISAPMFANLQYSGAMRGRYIIQTPGGYLRTITGLSGNVANLSAPINTSTLVGQNIGVYELNTARLAGLNETIGNLLGNLNSLQNAVTQIRTVRVGTVFMFASVFPPLTTLRCDGQEVSRTLYAELYAVIGTTWGAGDGVTTFNVPDFRGYVPRGWDNGRGIDPGRVFATAQDDQNKAHTHLIPGEGGGTANTPARTFAIGDRNPWGQYDLMQSSGGAEARMKNLAISFCIQA